MPPKANRHADEPGKAVWNELEKIIHEGHSPVRVFEDWLDLVLNGLLSWTYNYEQPGFFEKASKNQLTGPYEERYLKVVQKYHSERARGERPADYFAQAWGLLQYGTTHTQSDVLGEIFQQNVTRGEHGQYCTPTEISELMSRMLLPADEEHKDVNDPCCGSGRMLVHAAQQSPHAKLYGVDKDLRCARMSVINMWLFDLNAQITWGDSLTERYRTSWIVRKGGWVWEYERSDPTPSPPSPPKQLPLL